MKSLKNIKKVDAIEEPPANLKERFLNHVKMMVYTGKVKPKQTDSRNKIPILVYTQFFHC